MQLDVNKDELNKLEFISNFPKDGRNLYMLNYYTNDNELISHIPNKTGGLQKIKFKDLTEGSYWSKKIVDRNRDIFLEMHNMLANIFSYSEISNKLIDIENDIHKFGAIIHKQKIIYEYYKSNKIQPWQIYKTEIEYLMGLVRSFYGLVYDVLKFLLNKLNNCNLPKSLGTFADKNIDDMISKYSLNDSLARYFSNTIPLFRICRKMRDDIYHRGKEAGILFITGNGPGVATETIPFNYFKDYIWDDELSQNNLMGNKVGSLYYFVNKLVKLVLDSTNELPQVLYNTCKCPEPISKDYKMFIRGCEIKYLNDISCNLKKYWMCNGDDSDKG